MLAAIYDRLGPAREVLGVREVPDPVPAPGEVRVRVTLSGVNPSDCRARQHGRGVPLVFQISHSDGVGHIDAVGPGVAQERIGERVWLWNAAWMRPYGTAAQYVCLPARQAVPLPNHVSDELAACLGIPFMTAWHCLFSDCPVDCLEVLVAGGAGGGQRGCATGARGGRPRHRYRQFIGEGPHRARAWGGCHGRLPIRRGGRTIVAAGSR